MSSFCVQYLAESESGQLTHIVGSHFLHDLSPNDLINAADAFFAPGPEAKAYRVLDMGGGVHLFRMIDGTTP